MNTISVTSLLNESYRRELKAEGLIRPDANDDDVIWQQMTLNNFRSLIGSNKLYFKAHSEYTEYDEIKLREFAEPKIESQLKKHDNAVRELLKNDLLKIYDKIERHMFISCWYNSRYLSDVIFREYAKGDGGIAIGTTVGKLITCINNAYSQDSEIQNIFSGNVQYFSKSRLYDKSLGKSLFEPAQVYAPIFLKGMQFRLDHEFRVCIQWGKLEEHVCQGVTYKLLEVSPADLISLIAVKEDGIINIISEDALIQTFKDQFQIEMEKTSKTAYRGNGFKVFEVKKIGDVS